VAGRALWMSLHVKTVDRDRLRASAGGNSQGVTVAASANLGMDPVAYLLDAVCGRAPSASVVDTKAVAALARRQRVVGAVHDASPQLAALLSAEARTEVMQDMGARRTLRQLGEALDSAGLAWVVVKGPVLAELSYRGVPRRYVDLDLVVAAGDFATAIDALAGVGFEIEDRNWRRALRHQVGQLHLGRQGGDSLGVDLHWHLINPRRQRRRWAIPTAELLERRVRDGQVGAPVLEVTDRLIHYAVHVAISGGHRLGWVKDLERTVVNDPPDWNTLIERSMAWRVGLPVAAMLGRAAHTLAAPVPRQVIEALAPDPAQRALVRALRSWRPQGHLPGGGSLDRALTRALCDTVPTTVAGLGEQAADMAYRQVRPHPYWLDPGHPRHPLYAAGGPEAKEQYFEMVRATDRYGHSR
jgi:Uncharacterised nucleotidyltransferase